jgi:chorismate mutase
MNKLDLNSLRNELDEIDEKVLKLLSKRFDITLNVGKYKHKNNLEIFQQNREIKLLDSKIKIGLEFGLDKIFVKEIFQKIMDESKNKQKEYIESNKNE